MTTTATEEVLRAHGLASKTAKTDEVVATALNELLAVRSEEARLLEEVKAKDERIKELEAAVSAVMDALTTFDGGRVIVNMRRDGYAVVLAASSILAKVSP